MASTGATKWVLSAMAVFCQLLSLFPFAVLTEGVGFGEYIWWHYAAIYGAIIVFYLCGRLLGNWASGGGFSKRVKPVVMFLSRIGFIVPGAAFCVACALCGLHTGLFLYLLPGCIAAYFGGYLSAGREYSDIFTRGWFAVFFVAAVLAVVTLSFTHQPQLYSNGIRQLCISFGVLMILAALLTNQTNIDTQTRQRSASTVLPKGARSFNAGLIAAVGIVTVGACLFAKPIAEILAAGIRYIVRWLLSLIRGNEEEAVDDMLLDDNTSDSIDYTDNQNPFADLVLMLLAVGLAVLAIKYRRQIWNFIKEIFLPLFRVPVREEAMPFVDEYSASTDRQYRSSSQRSTEKELLRRYRKETDPVLKYRQGYELFMLSLGQSALPVIETDTTTVHSDKGRRAFGSRSEELPQGISDMVNVYERVRYGGEVPEKAELERLDSVLRQVRRR